MRKLLQKLRRSVRPQLQIQVQPVENKKVFLNLEGFADLDTEAQREVVANFLRAMSRNPEVRKQAIVRERDGKGQ
jgi:hypothetical protein